MCKKQAHMRLASAAYCVACNGCDEMSENSPNKDGV